MKNSNNTLDQILQKIKSKKDIIFFQTLPDIHLKKEMQIPSSFVSVSKSSINLSMSSSALCDCISISEIKNSHGLINKKFNEIISKTYANMEHISNVGFRFFTVYGPWGRPDMSPHKFTSNIFNSKKIILNNNGNIKRDFTFINDAVEATYLIHKKKISERELGLMSTNDNMIFNIGSSKLNNISTLINILEKLIGKKAYVEYSGAIKGDMEFTYSDNKSLMNYINYQPKTELENGLEKLVKWYNDHYMT